MALARAYFSPAFSRLSSPKLYACHGVGAVIRRSARAGTCHRWKKKVGFCVSASPAVEHSQIVDAKMDDLLSSVKWDEKGLAVAIVQNVDTGANLMQGFVNKEALAKTITSGKAIFYSRSRSSLWTKGETSMNFINVHAIFLDCDRDSIIYLGKPDGPTCHTGSETCYFSSISSILSGEKEENNNQLALTTLYSLEATINQRKNEIRTSMDRKPSWTKKLLLDNELLCSKIREEAEELAQTLLSNEDRSRTIAEMGDLMYHAMVLLAVKGVEMKEVLELLRKRFARSGIEENNRTDEIGTSMDSKPSWTNKLLLDNELLCSKIREEAEELAQTLLSNQDRSRTIAEMGDLMYHAMVLLAVKGVEMEEVLEVLRKRFARSGIEEKNSRKI